MTIKEPLAFYLPELNSLQIAALREWTAEAERLARIDELDMVSKQIVLENDTYMQYIVSRRATLNQKLGVSDDTPGL